ncbi:MAG: AraC family transcriptional regulator [Myxococcota bacterium]
MTKTRWLTVTPLQTSNIAMLARLQIRPGAPISLGAPGPALLVLASGQLKAQVGVHRHTVGPSDVVQVRAGHVLHASASEPANGWWLRVQPQASGWQIAQMHQHQPELVALLAQPSFDRQGLERLDAVVATAASAMQGILPKTAIGRLVRLALDRLYERVELPEMCRVAGLKKHAMIRRFRQHTGMTPAAFFLALRLGASLEPLANGARPIDVAHAFGFSDQSHYIRRFAAAFGSTPGAFQNNGDFVPSAAKFARAEPEADLARCTEYGVALAS